jgi:hemerythrin superfamily protein
MDCIVLLTNDHQQLDGLFASFEAGDVTVVPTICQTLEDHLLMETGVLYPAIGDEVDKAPVASSIDEANQIRALIRELNEFTSIDQAYIAKARDLIAVAREHMLDEESEIFPLVRALLSDERRAELGLAIEALRGDAAGSTNEGASSDGDTSWVEDPHVVDPQVDRSVEAAMRRSQRQPPDG